MGKRDAVRDFNQGVMQLETYGLRMASDPYEAYLAKHGIQMKSVASCIVDEEIIDHARGYNDQMMKQINQKFGEDFFSKAGSKTSQ